MFPLICNIQQKRRYELVILWVTAPSFDFSSSYSPKNGRLRDYICVNRNLAREVRSSETIITIIIIIIVGEIMQKRKFMQEHANSICRARKKDWDALVQWASESSIFLIQLLTLLVFWASWTSMLYHLSRKNVQRNYVLNVYLSFGWVNMNSHLSHRQNNLSWKNVHHICTLIW